MDPVCSRFRVAVAEVRSPSSARLGKIPGAEGYHEVL